MPTEFIDPGALRHELALEAASLAADGAVGQTESWTEDATLFARIEPVSAASRFGADQRLENVTHRMTVRHRADLRSGMRFNRLGRIFEILTVHDPDETGRYLVCRTKEQGL